MQSFRRIKIGSITRRGSSRLAVRDAYGVLVREKVKPVYTTCPRLRLAGAWLIEAGFRSGDRVRVEVSKGRLVITQEGGE